MGLDEVPVWKDWSPHNKKHCASSNIFTFETSIGKGRRKWWVFTIDNPDNMRANPNVLRAPNLSPMDPKRIWN